MPMYHRLGDVPRKRHIQFRDNGTLLNEEVFGLEGFSGNESILYHLQSPVRIRELGDFEPIVRDEWVPDAHAHRHFRTYDVPGEGDPISGRRLLMWNQDVEIALCRPAKRMEFFYRNGEGDEVIFVHEGSGTLETIFGDVPYREGDYIVVPRGTTAADEMGRTGQGDMAPGDQRWFAGDERRPDTAYRPDPPNRNPARDEGRSLDEEARILADDLIGQKSTTEGTAGRDWTDPPERHPE